MLKLVIHLYSEGEIVLTILQKYLRAFLLALRVKLANYLLRRKRFQRKAIGKNVTRLI